MKLKGGWRRIRKGLRWDGRRWARLEVTLPGTRIRRKKKVKAETLGEAEEAYREFRESVLNPEVSVPVAPVQAAVPTFESYVRARWPISRDAAQPMSPATAEDEWYSLDPKTAAAKASGILNLIGSVPIDQITEVTIEDFRSRLVVAGLSNCSVNHKVRLVAKILRHAQRRAKISAPALVDWPRNLPEKEVHNELSDDEIERFLGAFDTGVVSGGNGGPKASEYLTELFRSAKPLFVAALHLGLARSDLLSLRWSAVDFERGIVVLDRRKTSVRAMIPISDVARETLMTCRSRSVVSTEFVFVTAEGVPYSESTFTRYFRVAKKIAKISRPVRPHDLRHSFGSLLVSRGVPIEIVKRAMGHSNSRTTQRYARVSTDSLRQVADALNLSR